MFVKSGSAYETRETNGLSHFLEHALIRGPKNYSSSVDFWRALEDSGLSLRARIFKEFTLFSLKAVPKALPEAIETLSQILLSPRFDKGELESERQIVLEEALESLNARGVEIDVDNVASKLLWPTHPLGMTILGPVQNIKKFAVHDVKNYLQKFYQPNNMALCLAGAVGDRNRFEELVNKHFSPLRGVAAAAIPELCEKQKAPQISFIRNSNQSQLEAQVCFRALPYSHNLYTVLQALNIIFGNSGGSRLTTNILEKRGLVYRIRSVISSFSTTGTLDINFSVSRGKLVEVVTEILEEAATMKKGISDEEIRRAKVLMERNLLFSLDSLGYLADIYGLDLLLDSFKEPEKRLAEVKRISAQDIQSLAQKIFRPENLNLTVVGPYTKGQEAQVRKAIADFK